MHGLIYPYHAQSVVVWRKTITLLTVAHVLVEASLESTGYYLMNNFVTDTATRVTTRDLKWVSIKLYFIMKTL